MPEGRRGREEVRLPAGTIRYREAGEARPIVFVRDYLVGGRLWDGVVERLAEEIAEFAATPS